MSTDLMDTFETGVDYFNEQKWTQLESLMDDNVCMKRIDEQQPNMYHVGKQKVHHYFMTNGSADKAVFKQDPNPDIQIIGNLGFVSGTANFTGKTGQEARKIAYSFTYTRLSQGSNWYETHSWGKYI
jgi:hypothetical protein